MIFFVSLQVLNTNLMMNDGTYNTELGGTGNQTASGSQTNWERNRSIDGTLHSPNDNQKQAFQQQPTFQQNAFLAQNMARATECPFCGAHLDMDADFCETCHRYVRTDICSFCGTPLAEGEAYCPECGNPRGGVVCPVCHTINEFSFCKQCGTPVTEEAKVLVQSLKETPEYREMLAISEDLQDLDKCLPYNTEADRKLESYNEQLRSRLFELLKNDGDKAEKLADRKQQRMSAEELAKRKAECIEKLTALLDNFAITATPSPAVARNYAMASKPQGVRLAWLCNYKHALHSGPCGCAKPQLGGKWIILGKGNMDQIKDDN